MNTPNTTERRCTRCERPYKPKRKRTQRFCSRRCRDLARGERRRRAEGKPRDNVQRRCRVCLRLFTTKRYNAVYCSTPCKDHALHRRMNRKRRKSDREFVPTSDYIARMTRGIRDTWSPSEFATRKADAGDLAAAIIEARQREGSNADE